MKQYFDSDEYHEDHINGKIEQDRQMQQEQDKQMNDQLNKQMYEDIHEEEDFLDLIRELELSPGYIGLSSHTKGRLINYLKGSWFNQKELLATEIRKSMMSNNWFTPKKLVHG